jgi:non-haem dioxygenase in morphine synthesis N-terminal
MPDTMTTNTPTNPGPGNFQSIPILSLAAARDPSTKSQFLEQLRDTLLNVGFCYISDTGLPDSLIAKVKQQCIAFFDERVLPLPEKERIEMKNEKSFLGWSRVSCFFFSLPARGQGGPITKLKKYLRTMIAAAIYTLILLSYAAAKPQTKCPLPMCLISMHKPKRYQSCHQKCLVEKVRVCERRRNDYKNILYREQVFPSRMYPKPRLPPQNVSVSLSFRSLLRPCVWDISRDMINSSLTFCRCACF